MDTVNTGERKMLQSTAQSACFSFSCLLTHLLNMAELFKVQGSEISYTTVSGKETLSRIFRKHQSLVCNLRTANHYILQHQAMQDVIFRFTPQAVDKNTINLNENSEVDTIFFPAKSWKEFVDCTSNFCSCNAEEHMGAREFTAVTEKQLCLGHIAK